MHEDFAQAFASLKPILGKYARRMAVKADTPAEYTLVTKSPSPFPQHKGEPLHFGSVRVGKAYVSFHLMPLYMSKELTGNISPGLKKRMPGKTCFNFKTTPPPELVGELEELTEIGFRQWGDRKWL